MNRIQYIFLALATLASAHAGRVKDLAIVHGGRDNQLVGYGLVIGLAGDGDTDSQVTVNSVVNSLRRFGMAIEPSQLGTLDNVAAVMLTSNIPAFARKGTRIDVTVASIGDAKSLQGGVLLQTPLVGADDVVYSVAQGPIAVGGFLGGAAGPGGSTVQKNHPTVGIITDGAIVEREIPMEVVNQGYLNFVLRSPDYTTASRMAEAINVVFPSSTVALDAAVVKVAIPEIYEGREVDFITSVSAVNVVPDSPAKIVINERNGTIVATGAVRISTVAISHGALTITIANNQNVSQPGGLGQAGETAVTQSTNAEVNETHGKFKVLESFPTIQEVTAAFNALGVTTREMMSILQAMKTAGALQAELVIE